MALVCALGVAGMASAQIRSDKAALQSQQMSAKKANTLLMTNAPATKADARIDSVGTEPWYSWEGYYTMQWFSQEGQDLNTNGFAGEESIWWCYGTGGLPTEGGTGEIGYRFASAPGGFYDLLGLFPNLNYPVAVKTYLLRAPSTALTKTDSMPFYFKLYNSTKCGKQKVISDITGSSPSGATLLDVVYPTDPEKVSSISETVKVPCPDPVMNETAGIMMPGDVEVRAKFLDGTELLGDDFCVSFVFPYTGEESDTYWNAAPLIMTDGKSNIYSTEPASVYFVIDFENTALWDSTVVERPEGMVDETYQPNTRYAVVPMSSWWFTNGEGLDGEFPVWIFYSEQASLESPNPVDKFVSVSPVPAVDYVTVNSYDRINRIEVYSLNGKLMKNIACNDTKVNVNVSGLNSGMYIAKVYTEGGVASKKIVVK